MKDFGKSVHLIIFRSYTIYWVGYFLMSIAIAPSTLSLGTIAIDIKDHL